MSGSFIEGGRLYEQPQGRSVDRRVERISGLLHSMSRQGGWLSIPAELGLSDLPMALRLGKGWKNKEAFAPLFP
ncbi:MAG: hypothetical protein H6727_21055 [Myxococcales bacterium]|nr:hypothetical protein [Myxococcales bacterium]